MAGQEERAVRFDKELRIEACRFVGIKQQFPNHFHEHYVIGFVAQGRRALTCQNRDYVVGSGDLLLFNPRDSHACRQIGGHTLDWRSLNITETVMRATLRRLSGREALPRFAAPVVPRSAAAAPLRALHERLMEPGSGGQEQFFALVEQLIQSYAEATPETAGAAGGAVQKACAYMEKHFAEVITLDYLGELSGQNKYTLLRNFTKQRGVTPYQYLETIRISAAQKLLENGAAPLSAALLTGFTDQSHLAKYFKKLLGLTPRQYGDMFKSSSSGASKTNGSADVKMRHDH